MAVINRVARGILSLLDAKTGGNLPNDLGQVIQGGIDFTPFLLADIGLSGEQTTQSASVANIGGTRAQVDVPPGETWAVVAVSCTVVAPIAGGTFRICPAVRAAGSLTGFVNMTTVEGAYNMVVGESTINAVTLSQPWFLNSGGALACRIANAFGAAANVTTDVAFYRLNA